jgi:hypothetical protein
VTPYRPDFPYLEKRWHPQEETLSVNVNLGGLNTVFSGFSVLKQFYDDAYDILRRKHTNAGRPRVFADREQLIRKAQVAYVAIWHERKHVPLQKEVAERLGCNHNTFKDNWCKDGVRPWHMLFDLWVDNHR